MSITSISGRYCEQVATMSILIHQYVTESFAYISIIAVSIVVDCVIVLDILNYGFGIDEAQEERDLMWRTRKKNRKTGKPQI
jgi:hypothetical protein